MSKIRVGCIGLGQRGGSMTKQIVNNFSDRAEVVAVCDTYEDRTKTMADWVEAQGHKRPFETCDPYAVIHRDDVDAICIFTAWEWHIELATAAMQAGKYVGLEVGGAYEVNDCFKLVDTYEKTKKHCMMLENCCYGQRELMAMQLAAEGAFGEIVHCEGGYCHDLRNEISSGVEIRHYRLRNYTNRCCDNYPTHQLGPIAKLLEINRGNRMLTLSSFASKARGLKDYVKMNAEKYPHLQETEFNQGDIVTTVIKCARGETIVLTLDTTLPRLYSRNYSVRGTKGAYFENGDMLQLDSMGMNHETDSPKDIWGNGEKYREEHKHPLWEKYGERALKAGHGGMDFMVLSAFFEAVEKDAVPPIDTYDTAAWMVVTALSEQSIALGGAPVYVPDFTRGQWMMRGDSKSDLEFSLDL